MPSNKRLIVLLVFALIAVLALAACGGDDDNDKKESATATLAPTATEEPTAEPTVEPTVEPTEEPTAEPTVEPTEEPTVEPTAEPTEEPTVEPTAEPTEEPTAEPTAEPTEEPTAEPTAEPTEEPTAEPMVEPTVAPTAVAMAGGADLGVIKVGTNAEYRPFEYVDESGEIVGFDVDLMNAIAANQGFEVERTNTRWDGIFVALQQGEFDVVTSAVTITEEREQIIDFSNPYVKSGQSIAVKTDNPKNVQSPEDLPGLRVGVQSGTTGDIASSEIEGVEVVRYDEIPMAFQALANGDIDAIVNDTPVSAAIIAANPELGAMLVGDPFTEELYGIAVRQDFPELLNTINDGLAAIMADGTYGDICTKWFGTDAEAICMSGEAEAEPEATAEPMGEAMSLLDLATADGRFTTLLTVVDMAGVRETLEGEGPFTVFAPTDEAMGAMMADADLVNVMLADPEMLKAVLLYHVIPGQVLAADVAKLETATTAEGEDIAIAASDAGVVLNGSVNVIETDVMASNGVIHVVDGVLMPPSILEKLAAAAAPAAEATPEPEAAPVIAAPEGLIDCEAYDLSALKIGLVTDVGEIDDKSFNQSAWEGVLAAETCGATVDYVETQDAADYADNIATFADGDYDIVVTVGFALGVATVEAAAQYPEVQFIGVDQFQGEVVDNVVGLVFHEDQSGFLAGVLAGRLTKTGTIAAVLGTDQVPPVVAFNEGYKAGALYANPELNIISTYHPGAIDQAFTDPEWGAATAKQALDQDADVVFAAGGKTGNGGLIEVANAVGAGGPPPFCIGVDSDQWLTVPEAHPCLVSSAMKLLDVGVADIIKAKVDEKLEPGNFFGKAALADFHDLGDAVPDEVKAELVEVAAGLADGSIKTGYGE